MHQLSFWICILKLGSILGNSKLRRIELYHLNFSILRGAGLNYVTSILPINASYTRVKCLLWEWKLQSQTFLACLGDLAGLLFLCFCFVLIVHLTIDQAIGRAESKGGETVVGFSKWFLWNVLIIFWKRMIAEASFQVLSFFEKFFQNTE